MDEIGDEIGVILNSRSADYRARFHASFGAALPGWRIIDCPVTRLESVSAVLPAAGAVDFVIFTSQAAATLFPVNRLWAGKRVLAVGEATAAAAKANGFTQVIHSGQDVDDLKAYLRGHSFGQALYPSAEDVTADLAQAFPGRVQRVVTYRMAPRADLAGDLPRDWRKPVIAPLFSQRSAALLAAALKQALENTKEKSALAAVGISPDVLDASGGPWSDREVADEPTLEGVVRAAQRVAPRLIQRLTLQ